MTDAPIAETSDETSFLKGPTLSEGADFRNRLALFLDNLGSRSLKLFGNFWADVMEGIQPPTWRSLRPHTRPDLILSAFMLERPAGDARIYIRFVGGNLVETLGGEITGLALDQVARGDTLERWNASNAYCFDKRAVGAVEFDLGFSGRHFKMATTVMFPLRSETDAEQLLGFALWRN